jgi:hypothetical protein
MSAATAATLPATKPAGKAVDCAGPWPAGTAVGKAAAAFEVASADACTEPVGVGVEVGEGEVVAAAITRSLESHADSCVFGFEQAATGQAWPGTAPTPTLRTSAITRVSPVVAPVQVHVKEREVLSSPQESSPEMEPGSWKVPCPFVPWRFILTLKVASAVAVNVPTACTVELGGADAGSRVSTGVESAAEAGTTDTRRRRAPKARPSPDVALLRITILDSSKQVCSVAFDPAVYGPH